MKTSNPRPTAFHESKVNLFELEGRKMFTAVIDEKPVNHLVIDYNNGTYTGIPCPLSRKDFLLSEAVDALTGRDIPVTAKKLEGYTL